MKLIAATNNKNKIREFKEILAPLGFEILSMSETGFESDPEETGTTFEENAVIKAQALAKLADMPVLADDSGLEVDALGGAPGVYSARYASGSDLDRINKLLENMKGKTDRNAQFTSCVAVCFPNGKIITATGICRGTIAEKPAGNGGFGYDPIFYVEQFRRTYAELTPDEKNSVSHRGNALKLLREKLEKENLT